MLKLYDKNHNFIGRILKYADCRKESEAATGDATLSFTYLAGMFDIQNEFYVQTKDAEYVVKEVSGSRRDGQEIVAVLNLEDLEQNAFQEFSVTDATIEEAARLFLAGTGWRVGESTVTKRRNAGMKQVDARQGILKLCTAFMCEPVFDTRAKTVSFYDEIGEDKGVYFLKGLNLRKLSKTQTSYDFYTRLIPIGADGLTIEGVNGGLNYLENHQYSDKIRTTIWQDDSYTDAQALMEDAEKKLDDLSKPVVEYAADIIDLAAQKPEYGILSFHLGDTVTLIDQDTGTREKQRIRKITEYEREPEKNTCELGNTVLTFEELQARLQAAAEIVGYAMTSDGKIRVSDILKWEEGVAGSQAVQGLNSSVTSLNGQFGALSLLVGTINANYLSAEQADLKYADIERLEAAEATVHSIEGRYANFESLVTGELSALTARIDHITSTDITVEYLEANYAQIDLANIKDGCIKNAMIDIGAINTAQIADGAITNLKVAGDLDATKITAGTLSVDRLIIRGAEKSLVYELNNIDGALQSKSVDTLNGEIITPRTIMADRIVANSITGNEISANSITANHIVANSITSEEIAAGAVKAVNIDVKDLFAQDITATGTIRGVKLEAATGKFSGDVQAQKFRIGNNVIKVDTVKLSYFGLDSGVWDRICDPLSPGKEVDWIKLEDTITCRPVQNPDEDITGVNPSGALYFDSVSGIYAPCEMGGLTRLGTKELLVSGVTRTYHLVAAVINSSTYCENGKPFSNIYAAYSHSHSGYATSSQLSSLQSTVSSMQSTVNTLNTKMPRMESGQVSFGDVPANNKVLKSITFTRSFTSAPVVCISDAGSGYLNIITVSQVTTSGASFKCTNPTGASMPSRIGWWYAIGV